MGGRQEGQAARAQVGGFVEDPLVVGQRGGVFMCCESGCGGWLAYASRLRAHAAGCRVAVRPGAPARGAAWSARLHAVCGPRGSTPAGSKVSRDAVQALL